MSQKYCRFSIFSFCAIIFCFGVTSLYAQVPVPQKNVNFALNDVSPKQIVSLETIANATSAIVKIPSGTAEIPFTASSNPRTLSVLDMKGYDQEYIRNFTFKNTSNSTYTINSVDFEKPDDVFEFTTIVPGGSLPMNVAPGETFSVRIAYHGFERNELRSNILRFHTEGNAKPIIFPIQAIQQPLSAMPWNKKIAAANTK
jgi:hypothetical protein